MLKGTKGIVAASELTGLGTGVATALAINVGSAGAPVTNGGALGTPSSGVGTNITGNTAMSLSAVTKIGTLTRVMNTASGAVAYTGVGFLPSKVIFFAGFSATGWNAMSWGLDDGTLHKAISYNATASGVAFNTASAISLNDAAGATAQIGSISAFGADGFTVTWTLVGAGDAGTANVVYLAIK